MKTIDSFRGKYFFLSNFYPAKVYFRDILYDNNEAGFHAQKCQTEKEKLEFMHLEPSVAKRKGRRVKLVSKEKWDYKKDQVMYQLVLAKFIQNAKLRGLLIATGDAILVEGNTWGDKYWGVYYGKGQNKLGIITMRVREEIKECIILNERGV